MSAIAGQTTGPNGLKLLRQPMEYGYPRGNIDKKNPN